MSNKPIGKVKYTYTKKTEGKLPGKLTKVPKQVPTGDYSEMNEGLIIFMALLLTFLVCLITNG